jgi:hypothetical protein
MNCEDVRALFFELDKGESLPSAIREHTETCESCRLTIARMSNAMNMMPDQVGADWAVDERFVTHFTDSVMDMVYQERSADGAAKRASNRSLASWVVAGVIILAAMPLISFSNSFRWLSGAYGNRLDFPIHLIFGIIVAVYSLLFIGSHLKEISRWLHLKPYTISSESS